MLPPSSAETKEKISKTLKDKKSKQSEEVIKNRVLKSRGKISEGLKRNKEHINICTIKILLQSERNKKYWTHKKILYQKV